MSFLAKLRTQSKAEPTQCLGFVLGVDESGVATLALNLVNRRVDTDGTTAINEFAGPYTLQRAHLQHPPAFLCAEDLALLRCLVEGDDAWFGQSTSGLWPNHARGFLQRLQQTQRLWFLNDPEPLKWAGQAPSIIFVWQVQGDGTQCLVPKETGRVILVGNEAVTLNHGCIQLIGVKASEWLDWSSTAIQLEQVTAFRALNQSRFEQLGWPLPRVLPIVELQKADVSAQPVLVARSIVNSSSGKVRHVLQWQVRVECQTFCFSYSTFEQQTTVYSGERVYVVPTSSSVLKNEHQKVEGVFEKIGVKVTSRENGWEIIQKSHWQDLFFSGRQHLEDLGVILTCAPGFAFPYVSVPNLTVSANFVQEQLSLDLIASLNSERIHLTQLLKDLVLQDVNSEYIEINLDNERIVLIPKSTLTPLTEELGDWFDGGCKNLPSSHAYRIQGLNSLSGVEVEGDLPQVSKRLLSTPKEWQIETSHISAELRAYQWLGVYWLLHLYECGYNGLLADDMGLGKTLQTITFVSVLKQQKKLNGKVVIVAPTSLLHNWQQELRKFCTNLSAQVLHGPKRQILWVRGLKRDVIITSYGAFVNDVELWREQSIEWLILDEAQVIKNANTQARKALVSVESAHRLCLSGTPIENHLGEMWSLLDFLTPGILGGVTSFKRYYQKAIEKQGNTDLLAQLLKRIQPFILRRTKSQVATELPPKTEVEQLIELPDAQMNFYNSLKDQHWQTLQQDLTSTDNHGAQHMMVLTALLKLRQACCAPSLLGEEQIASGKLEYCLDMIQNLVDEGRSVLVFSQFTSVLDLLADGLSQLAIKTLMLTGRTQNRAERVSAFQAGDAPVFLISLKAGGAGLNLTQADTVIHFDPWWNSAAQAQATDRAHRIGQDKPVFVYKLIAQNTIEEKIMALQASKSLLSDAVNQTAEAGAHQFSVSLKDLMSLWEA